MENISHPDTDPATPNPERLLRDCGSWVGWVVVVVLVVVVVVVVVVCALVGGDGGGRWRTGGREGGREKLFVSQTAGKYISCHNHEFALCRLRGGVGLKHQSRTIRTVSLLYADCEEAWD